MSVNLLRLLIAALWFAVLVTSAGVVYVRYSERMQFAELDKQIAGRDRLSTDWNRLQLEQGTYTTPGFVEQVAINTLHMVAPAPSDVQLVQK
ncbi:MAG: cell division protein FtsL [Pseudomonadota bacterium]|jgi:cell division protein FtsL